MAIASWALSHNRHREVVVAIINHAQAGAARPALDARVQSVLRDVHHFKP